MAELFTGEISFCYEMMIMTGTSKGETSHGKRDTISQYEQKKLLDLANCFLFNQDYFCPYEEALIVIL